MSGVPGGPGGYLSAPPFTLSSSCSDRSSLSGCGSGGGADCAVGTSSGCFSSGMGFTSSSSWCRVFNIKLARWSGVVKDEWSGWWTRRILERAAVYVIQFLLVQFLFHLL